MYPFSLPIVELFSAVLGALPYDATIGIDAAVWASMGPRALETACRASKQRQALARFKVLTELTKLGAIPTAESSLACGVRILRTELSGNVALSVFDLPRLDGAVLQLPKGAFFLTRCCYITSIVFLIHFFFPHPLHAHTQIRFKALTAWYRAVEAAVHRRRRFKLRHPTFCSRSCGWNMPASLLATASASASATGSASASASGHRVSLPVPLAVARALAAARRQLASELMC